MFNIGRAITKNCQGVTRRELLQVGSLGMFGISLASVLRGEASQETRPVTEPGSPAGRRRQRETSCILIFLEGGPSQFEMFDPKPNAPVDIRGPYGNCSTNVSGTQLCELLPMMAQRMDRCALIRSLTGFTGQHTARPALTGAFNSLTTYGAVITRLKGAIGAMPPYVHLGGRIFNTPGIGGGVLGSSCDPIEIRDPFGRQVNLQQFTLNADVPPQRFQHRRELLGAVDQARAAAHRSRAIERMDTFHQRAVDMLTSPRVRQAFDLSQETDSLRERYGASHFGQSLVLARRLVEAGTRFVQVKWYDWDGPWDIHGFNSTGIERMEEELCPRFDQGLASLLDDLRDRGLLDSTLVVVLGEMGRTPRINHWGGRDHWGSVLFAVLAGGGVPGGRVIGSSDAHGAYPATFPVQPLEFAATIYRLLGIDTNLDPRVRPFIGSAAPVAGLV
ncbi:MAG: DUF1501 domain-containing protein [Planctomycetes bacterium]|nr:DUF1501 domain-containing protein [Planctomycetota bacterium]